MKRLVSILFITIVMAVAAQAQDAPRELVAALSDMDGVEIGTVTFSEVTADMVDDMDFPSESLEGTVAIWVQVQGLTPGFHGFHIHSVGVCDPTGERAFASAEGHLHNEGQAHGQHMGDLPSVLVSDSGIALLIVATDRFTLDDLMDQDGSAVIIHAGADNFGNIPADRYDPDADETTLNTGDAGGRVACGVIIQNT